MGPPPRVAEPRDSATRSGHKISTLSHIPNSKMPTVRLCICATNEEAVLPRFIDSFQPHVDSIHVVIARGALPPDGTQQILEARGIDFETYENRAPGTEDWPHTDHFAAARNAAFAMGLRADADWLMWADCDDVITDGAADFLRGLRAGAYHPPGEAIMGPYVTGTDGRYARRIRLVRPSHYISWENAVHEDIALREDTRTLWTPELQILHAPLSKKSGSTTRNRRILESIPETARTGREWFFLFQECELAGDIVAAVTAAIQATACPDLSDNEKATAYLTIGRNIRDPEGGEPPILEAARLQPDRREPFYALADLNYRRGRRDKAKSWLCLMNSIPIPNDPTWSHDPAVYGWKGEDLTRAVHGDWRDHVRRRRKAGIKIAVAHPTCRPDEAMAVRRMWLERAVNPDAIEYFFGIDAATAASGHLIADLPHAISAPVPEGYSTAVANYNAAAMACDAPVVIAAQDDIYPPPGWDLAVWQAIQPHTARPAALWLHDGHRGDNDPLMVIMCVTRPYLKAQGYLLCPDYDGYWSDTEFSWRAHRDGIVHDARHIKFFHNHPAFTGAASDEHYQRQQNPTANARGKAIFQKRNPDCPWVH